MDHIAVLNLHSGKQNGTGEDLVTVITCLDGKSGIPKSGHILTVGGMDIFPGTPVEAEGIAEGGSINLMSNASNNFLVAFSIPG